MSHGSDVRGGKPGAATALVQHVAGYVGGNRCCCRALVRTTVVLERLSCCCFPGACVGGRKAGRQQPTVTSAQVCVGGS